MSAATVSVNPKLPSGAIVQVGGTSFDDFHANLLGFGLTEDEAQALIDEVKNALVPLSAGVSAEAAAIQNIQRSMPGSQVQQAPAIYNGQAPSCAHGARVWKEGVSKAGKPYKLWSCPSRDRQDQCPPEWSK